MLILRKTKAYFGTIDGSKIRPDQLTLLSIEEIGSTMISTDHGPVMLSCIFEIAFASSIAEPSILIDGDCESIDNLAAGMSQGALCVLGSVGNFAGRGMHGGQLVIAGNARDHLGTGLVAGLVYVSGNCEQFLAGPEPGRKSGMRGGDIFIAGNCGLRACERMRRGTVFIGGNAGDYAVSQMIAGTLVVMGDLGKHWGGGMRRGSLVLAKESESAPTASLSEARDFELSFLPLVWRHIEQLQADALDVLSTAVALSAGWLLSASRTAPTPCKIPKTRWVRRQIADLNFHGRAEVLVLRRISSPGVA